MWQKLTLKSVWSIFSFRQQLHKTRRICPKKPSSSTEHQQQLLVKGAHLLADTFLSTSFSFSFSLACVSAPHGRSKSWRLSPPPVKGASGCILNPNYDVFSNIGKWFSQGYTRRWCTLCGYAVNALSRSGFEKFMPAWVAKRCRARRRCGCTVRTTSEADLSLLVGAVHTQKTHLSPTRCQHRMRENLNQFRVRDYVTNRILIQLIYENTLMSLEGKQT